MMPDKYFMLGLFFGAAGYLAVIVCKQMTAPMKGEPAAGAAVAPAAAPIAEEPLGPIDILVRRVLKCLLAAGALGGVYLWVMTPAREESSVPAEKASTPWLSRSQKLANININALRWSKDGFGTVMMATFRIDNDNPVAIKDVELTCVHSTKSGTVIDKNTRTVYEVINSNSYFYVRDFNMGFIHSQAAQSRCYVSDFVG